MTKNYYSGKELFVFFAHRATIADCCLPESLLNILRNVDHAHIMFYHHYSCSTPCFSVYVICVLPLAKLKKIDNSSIVYFLKR